jgi:hypothetical protein
MGSGNEGRAQHVVRLVGVYDADHTLWGELSYWFGARLGRAHCSLCDITHGSVREKSEWKSGRAGLPVPFDTYHRDDRPDDVRAATTAVPAVVAQTSAGFIPLLGPADLDGCAGSVDQLLAAIDSAMATAHLTFA